MPRLKVILKKKSGRGAGGRVSVRHQGGRQKRFLRKVSFVARKDSIRGRVESIEYDPNRTARIARIVYENGARTYVLAAENLSLGDTVEEGDKVAVKTGNRLPLGKVPLGTAVFNIELYAGKGGQLVRAAGASASVQAKEGEWTVLKLPSGEQRKFPSAVFATVGQVARVDKKPLGKAGAKRHRGIRPTVRGVAMHPAAHPHGGGEGRSGVGMPSPKTPWGKKARGVKTRKKRKYSDKFILERRKK